MVGVVRGTNVDGLVTDVSFLNGVFRMIVGPDVDCEVDTGA